MAAAQEAMARGDLDAAAAALQEAIEASDLPEAHEQLAGLRYFDDDLEGCRHHGERAFRGFRARGAHRRAARVGADLATVHVDLGNRAAAMGWLSRAERIVADEERCVEQGYVALALVACDWSDMDALERRADEALALALEFGDAGLEVLALTSSGYALVSQGRLEEGFARLDEALAVISAGEVDDPSTAGKGFCAMLSACEQAGAVRRAEEWTRIVHQLLLEPLGGRPRVIHTHCRLAYGTVLCTIGRWDEADAALSEASGPTASPGHRGGASCRLAQLRVLQGRLEDAAALLAPYEDRLEACLPLAMLHLAEGEPDLAAAVVAGGLDRFVADRWREAALLGLLVEIEVDRDLDRAADAVARLEEVVARAAVPALAAECALARGRLAAASGDHDAAVAILADGSRCLGEEDRPLLHATLRFERARALAEAGHGAEAITEARAALTGFERLGAARSVDRTQALLRSLGAPGRLRASAMRAAVGDLTSRERDVLDLLRQGLTNAEIGARLFISAKTVEHHVGRVLAKLGVRSRAEAAAVAAASVTE